MSDLTLSPGARVVDVGCGEGRQALRLAEGFEFAVTGFDPLPRHIQLAKEELANAAKRQPELNDRVRFELGTAEALPVDDESVDLVWCKDVLGQVAALDKAYGEFRRVLRQGSRALVFQSLFATYPLDPRGAEPVWKTSGVVPTGTAPSRTEAAIVAAGLYVEERIEVGIEWREWAEEQTGEASRQLLHAARLMRDPERYIAAFGQMAYDIMLGDCLWHVYHLIGNSALASISSVDREPFPGVVEPACYGVMRAA